MTQLNRRNVLAGAAAASAATAFSPLAAHAAAPLAGNQAPGWYRYKVGSIEVTVVTDGSNTFKFSDGHLTNKTRDDLNGALEAAFSRRT